jgi:ribosomal protein L6P/L9E
MTSYTCFKSIFFSETYSCFFSNLFLGFFRNYFYFLKIKGMGFKMIGHMCGIIVKLGYSHRILYTRQKEIALTYLNRRLLKIEGRSLSLIKTSLFRFIKLKKRSIYKKKGIFLKGSILKIKLTSKKSKF